MSQSKFKQIAQKSKWKGNSQIEIYIRFQKQDYVTLFETLFKGSLKIECDKTLQQRNDNELNTPSIKGHSTVGF